MILGAVASPTPSRDRKRKGAHGKQIGENMQSEIFHLEFPIQQLQSHNKATE